MHLKNISGYIFQSFLFFFTAIILSQSVSAQKNILHQDPDLLLKDAVQLYHKKLYADAQPLFKKYIEKADLPTSSDHQLRTDKATFHYLVCAINLDQPHAISKAEDYIKQSVSLANRQKMNYQLGHYYFKKENFKKAVTYYENTGIDNFSNEEIAKKKFEQAYAYFNLQEFDKALPLFDAVKNIHNSYYIPANYYTGYISLLKKDYSHALTSFRKVMSEPKYNKVVPYYISEIFYYQNKYDKLLSFATPYIKKGDLYYDMDLRHLVGQTYFEKKAYKKALPFLEEYEKQTNALHKEDVYELAYCYYKTGQLQKAISGFKQLSGGTDSLAQNSMYILGDCYLKTGQKAEARQAFAFCARASYNPRQQEVSKFNYGKLSYELGYQDAALKTLKTFIKDYPNSEYNQEAREILAHLFMNTADYKDALVVLKNLPKDKRSIRKAFQRITFGRAMQLINDEQLSDANELLNQSLQYKVDQKFVLLAYFWQGEIAFRNKDYNTAIINLQKYISSQGNTHPGLGEANIQTAHYDMGYSYLKKGQYANALPHFQKAQHTFGSNGGSIANDARLREADCYYMLKNYDKAAKTYNQAIRAGKAGSDYALYQKAIIAGITGDQQQKVAILSKIPKYHPKSTYEGRANYQIGLTYMNEGKYKAAIRYFQKIVDKKSNPDAPKAALKMALAHVKIHENDLAIQQYKILIQNYPNSPQAREALNSLKNVYISKGQTQKYFSYLNSIGRSLNVSEEDSLTYAAAESSFADEEYKKAVRQFSQYLSQYPKGHFIAKAHFYRAESAYEEENYDMAVKDYEAVIQYNLTAFIEHAAYRAAYINFHKKKDYVSALKDYKQLKISATGKENMLTALRGILRSNYELKNWSDVQTAAKNLLKLENISTGDQIVSHFYLGRASQEQNNYAAAIPDYQKVADMTTSELGAESRYYIAQCKFLLDDLKEAEKAAFEVIKKTPSYDLWVAKSYLLLGKVFWKEKDYFNAKATLQSIVEHSDMTKIAQQAATLLEKVKADEKAQSKIIDTSSKSSTDTSISR